MGKEEATAETKDVGESDQEDEDEDDDDDQEEAVGESDDADDQDQQDDNDEAENEDVVGDDDDDDDDELGETTGETTELGTPQDAIKRDSQWDTKAFGAANGTQWPKGQKGKK